jgi:outer membrane protein TolC
LVAEELNRRTKLPREETLLRIRAQVSNARQELISAENNVSVTRSLFFNVIGINDDRQYKVMPVEAHSEKVLSKEDVYPGLKNNIELLKLEEEIKKAKESSKIARSINYPQINLLASYGYEWSQFPPQQDDWVAGITLDMPLWDWHRTKSRIKQAQAYVEETENTKNSSEKQLLYELESAYLNYTANIERAKIAKEGLQYAQKSLSLFEKRYKDATATSIELLDAGQAYLQARLNYIQAELDIRLAKAEIERITGRQQ